MPKMLFLNLPVRNLKASTAFYEALGAKVNPQFSNDQTRSMVLSETIIVMLLSHERYRAFTKRKIGDARQDSQALIAISIDKRDEVDAIVKRTTAAKGKADPNPPQDHGFMYSRSVEDPDGYVWELVWMNPDAMKKG